MNISNINDWFIEIDKQSEKIRKYEDTIFDYYKKVLHKNLDISKPLMKDFYKSESKWLSIFKSVLHKVLLTFILSLVVTVIFTILSLDKYESNLVELGLFSLKIECISFISILAIIFIIYLLRYNLYISKINKLENNIIDIIKTIPPNFRSFDRVSGLTKIYFTDQNEPIDNIFNICEDIVIKQSSFPYFKVLFDLPYKNNLLKNTNTNYNEQVKTQNNIQIDDSETEKSPYLPADIDTKVMKGSDNSEKDLQSMIGLSSVKQQIEKLENRMKFYGTSNNNGNHMVFMGAAGTGKTTVARIVTKILYDIGYIKKNQYIEISGDYLRSGDTQRANAILEYSYGGVLFIDEAYLLYNKNGQSMDATGVLLKAMEDHRSDFVVILAGYEEQMTKLLASNEGFTSRIKHTIYFPDYTEQEMLDIFKYFISNYNNKKYTITEEASNLLLELFSLEKKSKSFGNARTVRNCVDGVMDYYADKHINSNIKNNNTIEVDEVQKYFDDRKVILQHEIKNTSATNQLDGQIIRQSELKNKLKDGSTDPDKDLHNLIGLESFKNEIDILENQKNFYNEINIQKVMIIGPKSSGKSSLTKVLTGYLYKLGYIQENKYLEISAEFLKGSYTGHTAKRAESIISYASGGVLYIKNIHLLLDATDAFSNEALSAIYTAISSNEITIVIADEYSDYLEQIKNLFTIIYEIPKYTKEQLYKVFLNLLSIDNFEIHEYAATKVFDYINTTNNIELQDIIHLYNDTKKNHINNFNGIDNKFIIVPEDIIVNNPSNILNNITPKVNIKLNI